HRRARRCGGAAAVGGGSRLRRRRRGRRGIRVVRRARAGGDVLMRPGLRALAVVAALPATGCEAQLDVLEPMRAAARDPAGHPAHAGARADAKAPAPERAARAIGAAVPPDHAVTDLQAALDDTCAVAGGTLYCWGARADVGNALVAERVPGSAAGAFRFVSA